MNKILHILLVLLFSLTIISCGSDDGGSSASTDNTSSTTTSDDDSTSTDNSSSSSDTTAPLLLEITAVTTPTDNNTPNYTFYTTEAGTITYGGSCSSGTTSATIGNNTITFSVLSDGTYSDCTIIVKDSVGNASNTLAITSFEVLPSYVAVGTSGTILTSSDGTSWDNKSSGTTGNLNGVTYGNDKFITVGNSGTILTSSNGTSWNSTSWTCSACTDNISAYTLSDVTYKD